MEIRHLKMALCRRDDAGKLIGDFVCIRKVKINGEDIEVKTMESSQAESYLENIETKYTHNPGAKDNDNLYTLAGTMVGYVTQKAGRKTFNVLQLEIPVPM